MELNFMFGNKQGQKIKYQILTQIRNQISSNPKSKALQQEKNQAIYANKPKDATLLVVEYRKEVIQSNKIDRMSIGSSGKRKTINMRGSYRQKLLREDDSQLDIYDPFETPPNFVKAQRHQSGMSIGIPSLQTSAIKDIQVCPCCQNPINKELISICCKQYELLFLGVGYPLYFKLAKYITAIIVLVFLISGSGLSYLLRTECHKDCLSFFGFVIVDFEIEQSEQGMVEVMNMVTAIVIFGVGIYVKSLINNDIMTLESKVVCPSQYTIMLHNLPKNFEEFQLKKWIKQTFEHESISINLGYNVQKLQHAYQTRNSLTIQLRKLQIKRTEVFKSQLKLSSREKLQSHYLPDESFQDEKQKQLTIEIEKYDRVIHDYRNNMTDCDKNGTAFVTFESAQVADEIIEKYEQIEIVNFFSRTIASVMRSNALQFKGRVIKVTCAPAPRQVIWQNLEHSHFRSFTFQVFFISSMMLLIYFAFKYQYQFSAYAYELRKKASMQSRSALILFQAVIASLIVVLVNSFLRIIILVFTKLKRYHSYTSQQSSFCFYYTLMYIFNSCFMIYIIHGQYPQESSQLLLYDIHLIMLANAFSEPLFKLFDPIMWHKIIWKRYIQSLSPDRNPYTQMYVHRYFEGHQISNGDNYQYIARILVVTVWFAHAAPLGVVFCVVGIGVDYWIGKVMLLRVYKKPENISKSIASFILNSFELLPLIYICGVLQFTYKSTFSNVSLVQFLLSFFKYSITVSVLIICILGYLIFFKVSTRVIPKTSYSEIRNYFGFNYETQNPMTRFRGQINYLQNIMKNIKGGAWMNVHSKEDINMISELSKCTNEPQGMDRMRAGLARIKIKIQNSRQMQDSQDEDIQLRQVSDREKRVNEIRYSLSSDSQVQENGHVSENVKRRKEKVMFKRTRSIMK